MKQFLSKMIPKYDKLKHLYIVTLLFIAFSLFTETAIALVIVTVIVVLKELLYDKLMRKGTPEIMDVFWGVLIPAILTLKYYFL